MNFKKFILPIAIVIIPLIILNDIFAFTTISKYFSGIWFFSSIINIVLFTVLIIVASKIYAPPIPMNAKTQDSIYGFIIAAVFIGISSLVTYIHYGIDSTTKTFFSGLIPGTYFLPFIAVACVGLFEMLKEKIKSEKKLIGIGFIFLALIKILSFMPFHPLAPFLYSPADNFNIQLSVISFQNISSAIQLLPDPTLFVLCLVYLRLGLIPTLISSFFISLLSYLSSQFGLHPGYIPQWAAAIIILLFFLKPQRRFQESKILLDNKIQ